MYMPKVSLDMPNEIVEDLKEHVGDSKKFVSLADAIRTACRKMLDQLDEIDYRHGRLEE
jgi:Arc/MetJ-type ribon-helix-helix transcriptional regulator|tara:strand:- start:1733 stop:1909 length:177 start_codon:yes stop_codon:yes gene_type:complete